MDIEGGEKSDTSISVGVNLHIYVGLLYSRCFLLWPNRRIKGKGGKKGNGPPWLIDDLPLGMNPIAEAVGPVEGKIRVKRDRLGWVTLKVNDYSWGVYMDKPSNPKQVFITEICESEEEGIRREWAWESGHEQRRRLSHIEYAHRLKG